MRQILVGGGMIFTFYKALGYGIGASLVEEDMVELAASLMKKAEEKGSKCCSLWMLLSLTNLTTMPIRPLQMSRTFPENGWDWISDPKPSNSSKRRLMSAKTIVWNGPMGVFEMSNFAEGTNEVAKMLAAAATERGAVTIVGGGDSVAAINKAGLGDKVSHISTGGGASLELLEGKTLPGRRSVRCIKETHYKRRWYVSLITNF
ncbi:phosphoglycerate kinase [Nitzschia inconspicua]|uniref:phosphoglycerate kinase n=1 Tax=Nitzschia inconspicua TaxID=303405 RepID=A0A9K3K6P3_9STRA|nr:phosphoglycerate kinase [Nitzschia inconspicua]